MRTAFSYIFVAIIYASPISAQERSIVRVEEYINKSQICERLPEFDFIEISKRLGMNLPIPFFVDGAARWDKNRHNVINFDLDPSAIHLDLVLGCQPSDEGEIIKLLGMSGDQFRLTDNATCTGNFEEARTVKLSCQVSGELGKLIGSAINLDSFVSDAVSAALSN